MEYLIIAVMVVVSISVTVQLNKRMPNPIRARCPACHSKMYLHPPGKWNIAVHAVWQVLCWLVVWRLNPPLLLGFSFVFVLAIPAMRAINRTYYAIWMYWHPLRCGEGGHPAPVPTNA